MSNEGFIAMRKVQDDPQDIKSAIDMLCEVIKKQNNPELLLKIGAVKGAYAVYERTKDTAILEQIFIDIAVIFKGILDPAAPSYEPMDYQGPFKGRTDLIFMQPASVTEEKSITKRALIEGCLEFEARGYSQNTRYSYSAGLKKILGEEEIFTYTRLRELLVELDKMKDSTNINHNVKSAITVLKKYIHRLLENN